MTAVMQQRSGDGQAQAQESNATSDLRVGVAFYENARDAAPTHTGTLRWAELVPRLTKHTVRAKKDGPAFSMVTMKAGAGRRNESVLSLSGVVLDFDSGKAIVDAAGPLAGIEHVLYTTHSHRPEVPRFRIVLPLAREVSPAEYPAVWRGAVALCGGGADGACKDPSRLFFLPSHPAGAEAIRFAGHERGRVLDPAELIALDRQREGGDNVLQLPSRQDAARGARDVNAEVLGHEPWDETPENVQRVRSMLAAIPADCEYEKWRSVVGAVQSLDWVDGEGLARDWSATAHDKFDADAFRKLWDGGLGKTTGLSIGTLLRCAREQGWADPQGPAVALTPMADGGVAAADPIEELNKRYFLAPVGDGGVSHWEVRADPDTGQTVAHPIKSLAFSLALENKVVSVQEGGRMRPQAASRYFNRHPRRRQYDRVMFAPGAPERPGVFNLWSGFAVEPASGDVGLFTRLMEALLPDPVMRNYVLRWMAHLVQRPGVRTDVAVVLRGGRGVGKGSLARVLLAIFGRYGLHITQPRHLTGNFNAHLAHTAFVFADEAVWAGDRSATGPLKTLITEPTLLIERKGFDAAPARNCVSVLFASNEGWVVPAGDDERRFAVTDCGDALRGEHGFFHNYNAWLEEGGVAAVLSHLLSIDLSGWEPRKVPHTAALDEQKLHTLDPLDRWVYSRLTEGVALDWPECEWRTEVLRSDVCRGVADDVRREGRTHQQFDPMTVGKRLRELIGASDGPQRRDGHSRNRTWLLPELPEARARAARVLGIAHPRWEE